MRHALHRVVEVELLGVGAFLEAKLLRRGCFDLPVRGVVTLLVASERQGRHLYADVVAAALEMLRKLRDGALLRCNHCSHDLAHP